MKALNFDQLLDNDNLTPDQERFVRRLFNYKIEEIEDPIPPQKYLLRYSYKENPDKVRSSVAEPTLSTLKTTGYKLAMLHFVYKYSNKIKCLENRNKIKQLIISGTTQEPIDSRTGFVMFTHREDNPSESFQCPSWEYIKVQNIYQCLMIALSEINNHG